VVPGKLLARFNRLQTKYKTHKWDEILKLCRWWSLCLTGNHIMQTYRQTEVQLHAFLTLALDRGAWSGLCPGCFNSKERGYQHPFGELVGPRVGMDALKE